MSNLADLPEFLTVEEAAQLLRLHPRSIRNRITAGVLPAKQVKGGKGKLIAKADVLGLLEDVVPSTPSPSLETSDTLTPPTPGEQHGSGEHLQQVLEALEKDPVGFQRWAPVAKNTRNKE